MRKVLLALAALFLGFHAAAAQTVPVIGDTDRYQSYVLTTSTPTVAVSFPVFGDCTDLNVRLNGTALTYPTQWTCASASSRPLNTIALPITDIVITFASAPSSGTLEIIGSWHARRLAQPSTPGLTRYEFNETVSGLTAALRENQHQVVPPPFNVGYALESNGPGVPPIWQPLVANTLTAGQTLPTGLTIPSPAPITIGDVPFDDWLGRYSYGDHNSRFVAESTTGEAAITGASRTSTSLGGASAAIGLMGWGFADATGGIAGMPAWGGYFECRKYASASSAYCEGVEIDMTDFSGNYVATDPYNEFQQGNTGALHLAAGGNCTMANPCYNPATHATDQVSGRVPYALLFSANGNVFTHGILFGAASIYGADGTDTGGIGIAQAMARGQFLGWYAPGNLQKFSLGSTAKSSDISGSLQWSQAGLQLLNGSNVVTQQFYAGPNAVNGIGLISGNTNINPVVTAFGTDTNVGLDIKMQGSGSIFAKSATSNDIKVILDNVTAGNAAFMQFMDASTLEYEVGKDSSNDLIIYDFTTSKNALFLGSGNLSLGETGKSVTLIGSVAMSNLPTSGTVKGSICIDTSNNIYVKTTAGSCL